MEENQAFTPVNRGSSETFSIVTPPQMQMGTCILLQQTLCKMLQFITKHYERKATLFVPGADHAGFETQVVLKKNSTKQGRVGFDFSREDLYKQIWDFVAQNKSNYQQFRRLGASVDWNSFYIHS